MGALSFPLTEGTPAARAHFNRGLLALHSFWYDEALRQFAAASEADPSMNMAHWGQAMSHVKLLWGDDDVIAAKTALAAMPDPDKLSPYEKGWIAATTELLKPPDVLGSRLAFAKALEQLMTQFPADDEFATFYALTLLSTIRPENPDNLTIREKAAAIAETVFKRNPKHPGAAHYLIHADDTPALASKALDAAKTYRLIAPAAFHAQHMPAHIFVRLGMWADAIKSCQKAWDVSVATMQRNRLSANHVDIHSLQWLIEMPFELGHRKVADDAMAKYALAINTGVSRRYRSFYATEVASYLARTSEWNRVDELLAPLSSPPVEDGPGPGATGQCGGGVSSASELGEKIAVLETRARAAAMQHDVAGTKKLITELDATRAQLAPTLKASQPAATVAAFDTQTSRLERELLARAANDSAALITVLREASADAHVDTGGESNPTAFLAEEELADALLGAKDPAKAAEAYAHVLTAQPNRAHSLLGAARAAAAQGDTKSAARSYAALVTLWSDAEPTTPGLDEARAAKP
ncbi:MAG TPA: tetratricopeptide repeat protein [Kofleriaceae bacterium]